MKIQNIIMAAALLFAAAIETKAQATASTEDLDTKYATTLVKPGTTAPDFNSFRGKTVVLDFWASWCPDCRKDAPEIVRLYNEYHPKGVEFIGISMDTDVQAWRNAIQKYGIVYPQVSELKKFKETDISKSYGINWIPSIVVVDKDGKVLLSTVLSSKVDQLLKELTK